MLLLSFLIEVPPSDYLLMPVHVTIETCPIVVLLCQSRVHLLLPFASLGGRGFLPLLVCPPTKENLDLFLLKACFGNSHHVQLF